RLRVILVDARERGERIVEALGVAGLLGERDEVLRQLEIDAAKVRGLAEVATRALDIALRLFELRELQERLAVLRRHGDDLFPRSQRRGIVVAVLRDLRERLEHIERARFGFDRELQLRLRRRDVT